MVSGCQCGFTAAFRHIQSLMLMRRPFDCPGEWIAMHWSDWRVQAAESRKQNISIHILIEFFLEKDKSWIQEY